MDITETKKAGTPWKRTLRLAKQAKLLYLQGKTREQIAIELGKSLPQIHRYFQMTGGITNEDKARHYKRRFLK